MLRSSKAVLLFIFISLLLVVQTGCIRRKARRPAWRDDSDWLVPHHLLKDSPLIRVWENRLPITTSEALAGLFVFDDGLYVLGDSNLLFCLDTDSGKMMFAEQIGEKGVPVVGLDVFADELFSVVGGSLVEIDRHNGERKNAIRLGYEVTCPAARNRSFFYVGSADRKVHVLRADDKVQVFLAAAQNDSTINSLIADEKFVVFATEGGNCIAMAPDRPEMFWQFDVEAAIIAPVVRDIDSIYFACKDTNVYKLNIFTGRFVWKHQAGAMLDRGPRLGESVVYQYAQGRGLMAVDKSSGRLLWRLDNGLDLVTETNDIAFVVTGGNDLVAMDNKKAEQLYSVNLTGVSKYAVNTADNKIYLAAEDGRVVCLAPED